MKSSLQKKIKIYRNGFLFSLTLILSIIISCQNNLRSVKIRVATHLPSNSKIYIAGNNDQLGNWNPDSIELDRNDKFWEKEFSFNTGEKIEFKFTRGSWDTEALNEKGEILNNHSIQITVDTVLTFFIESWQNPDSIKHFSGGITGKVKYHRNVIFKDLLPRDIIVWLPPGYDENTDVSYPVFYMHDGQNIIDPATSFSKIDWQFDEAADSLIRNNIIEPLIVVGIYNTIDRSEEYSDSEKGIEYGKFIINKLKPFIDRNYRTLPGRENTAVGGSSLGGLAAFLIAWNHSDHFSKTACYSPAFKYDEFDHTEMVKNYDGPKKDLKIFIYNGGKDVDTLLQDGVDIMISVLKRKGYKENIDIYTEIDSTAGHNESFWAEQVDPMLKYFFPNKK